jgi:hypothetical protein
MDEAALGGFIHIAPGAERSSCRERDRASSRSNEKEGKVLRAEAAGSDKNL